MTFPLRRLTVALAATALVFTGVTAAAPPVAQAGTTCTWMTPHAPGDTVTSTIKRIAGTGGVSWNMLPGYGCVTSFPSGGSLYVRVQTLVRTSAGCTDSLIGTYAWRHFTSASWQPLATINPGQCFRLQFKAGNASSAYYTHYGKLYD